MIKASDFFVSVVVPIRQEGDLVKVLVSELTAILAPSYRHYEVILVQIGSDQQTRNVILQQVKDTVGIRYIRLSRFSTDEVAIAAGLDTAIGDVVVVIRPDIDPTDRLQDFIAETRRQNGVVYGIEKVRQGESGFTGLLRNLFYSFAQSSLDFEMPPKGATPYMGLSRAALNAVIGIKERSKYLRIAGAIVGFPQSTITYETRLRTGSRPQRSLADNLRLAKEQVVSNSTRPLRFASYLSLLAALGNLLYVGYVWAVNLFLDNVEKGWTTLSLQNSAMFFVVSLVLAILAEYFSHFMGQIQERPTYFVVEEVGSTSRLINLEVPNVVAQAND